MQRYWFSNGDGQTHGPYSVDELRRFATEGRVTATSTLCEEGTTVWLPATQILGSFASAGIARSGAAATSWEPVSIVGPILATLFCCVPCGIISIVHATNANTKASIGDMAGAEAAKASAKTWLTLSVLPGAIIGFVTLGAVVIGALNGR